MSYGKFPRPKRWLEFESYDDFLRYNENGHKQALWPSSVEKKVSEFHDLINDRATENRIQHFLEQNPYLLPGFGDLHHGPYDGIIATKLPLGNSFITDFAYIASNSQTLHFTCVEIESARKRLFRSDGKFHRDYLDARQQISDWLFWAKENRRDAIDCWGSMFNGRPPNWYDIEFRGFLVFGRRNEIDSRAKQERWSAEAASLNANLRTMTYDRLIQKRGCLFYDVDNQKLALCAYRDRRFVVKKVIT